MIEYIILGLLYVKARSGYDIKKLMEENISMFYKASNGSIYPALRKLEEKGFIEMGLEKLGQREKKIYQITKEGKVMFKKWLLEPISYNPSNMQECVKVFFLDFLEPIEREQVLRDLEEKLKQGLEELKAIEKQYAREEEIKNRYYRMSTLYYGIGICKETLRWCQYIRQEKPLTEFV